MSPRPYGSAAIAYLTAGYWPLPLPPRKKASPPEGYTGRNGREVGRPDVDRWITENRSGNIGLRLPRGVAGIDVDAYKDDSHREAWEELVKRCGPPPDAPWCSSRDDGVSGVRLFRVPEDWEAAGKLPAGSNGISPGEVIQWHHRYVVCPPSIHPETGRAYRWRSGSITKTADLPPLPGPWLEALCIAAVPAPPPRQAAAPGLGHLEGRPGDDFNERADWLADILEPHGWTLHHEAGGTRYVTRPGKSTREGHSATIGHSKDGVERLYVFSADAAPFEMEKPYTKYGAYTLLNHGGDWQAAARDLGRAGYGTRAPRPAGGTAGVRQRSGSAYHNETDGKKDGGWEDLVPLGTRAPLPPFPVDTLPGYIAAMVKAVATEVQVPADLPGALAMGVLSTAAGGRAEIVVRGQWREPMNLYLATALPPGSGKSPAFRIMCAPIFSAEHELREKAAGQILAATVERETRIAEAEAKRRKAKEAADIRAAVQELSMAGALTVPVMPRLTADDVVPEQAATIMADQGGRLAILSAEGTFFSVIMGRYTNGTPNVELALKGHAGDRVQVDRRGRAELVERPALTIATTVQPTVLREIAAKPAMRERGILARFLLSLPPDLVGHREITPDLVPDDVLQDYSATVKKLILDLAEWTDPAVLTLTPAALKLHTEWRAEIEPRLAQGTGDLEALRDWASKLPGATARLAGLLHLAENPASGPRIPVEDETMKRAIEQARYWAEHAMTAFGAMHAHPALDDARAVLEWIRHRDEPGSNFTKRDVHRTLIRRFPRADEAAAALTVLEDHGYIRRAEVPPGPGRKPVIFDVHPRAVTN